MKQALCSAVALIALCLLTATATASDLKLNGTTSVQLPPGANLHIELTGNPGLLGLIILDIDNGPVLLKGETFPLGVTPLFTVFKMGLTDGNGLLEFSGVTPSDPILLGFDIFLAGVIMDRSDPNGYDISNGADYLGVPETCTPAVQAACIAAGLEACTSGTPDCGPPINLCTPAVTEACTIAGFCSCDPLTGACENTLGAGGICCMPSEQDSCGVCFGNGQGHIGCGASPVCAGVGTCACNECDCPAPKFGAFCQCTETSALYNGTFQHSIIASTPDTLMESGEGLTYEGWVFMTRTGEAIGTRKGSSGILWAFAVGQPGSGSAPMKLRLFNNLGGGSNVMTGNAVVPLNEWHHIAFTWDGTTNQAKFYIDGILDATGTFTPRAPTPGDFELGLEGTDYFEGKMDDMRMWGRVRTPSEIADNYDKSLPGNGVADLVFNHNMQKWTAGNVATIDYSDNGHHLVHSLFVIPTANNAPAPLPETQETCPNDCNGAGACVCGVCTCYTQEDISYDCALSAGGG